MISNVIDTTSTPVKQTPNKQRLVGNLSNSSSTNKALKLYKKNMKIRIKAMKLRIMNRNRLFHENDLIDFTAAATTPILKTTSNVTTTMTSTPNELYSKHHQSCKECSQQVFNSNNEYYKNSRYTANSTFNSTHSSNSSSGIIGDDVGNFLSSTIIGAEDDINTNNIYNTHRIYNNQEKQASACVCSCGCENKLLINEENEINLQQLKKTLNKIKKLNKKFNRNNYNDEYDTYNTNSALIRTSTSTNLKSSLTKSTTVSSSTCYQTTTTSSVNSVNSSNKQSKSKKSKRNTINASPSIPISNTTNSNDVKLFNLNYNKFYRNLNVYNDIQKYKQTVCDKSIYLNQFHDFGEFKVWYI